MDNESVELSQGEAEEEEEFVLLNLDEVSGHIDIPRNAPYVLSGLDSLNPTLIIDGKIKLVGEYMETIGTCLAFTEKEVASGENQTAQKQVEPVAKLHKILKFRLVLDNDNDNGRGDAS
ncbi:PREDICTED: uncharacterized protein LOC104815550 [Tarenaya hassleriana]|uniref:uncharacterized protein LOC104815550 n=1 Tax=Tarenaya hassleriana TaxID=28532 RepID=UPI00053C177E|nr:PREDICTED: uncharacterized protein LOC104815550 [Tarenaya hassleriana]XP_010542281.1 PREDICTED: uncharacterized protein LOC104815550 [Tarenaya hassleriana]XP_019058311.1 PREDICTED: uncharacterized protein LOC104815550 [Tarenaya hassleriana]